MKKYVIANGKNIKKDTINRSELRKGVYEYETKESAKKMQKICMPYSVENEEYKILEIIEGC